MGLADESSHYKYYGRKPSLGIDSPEMVPGFSPSVDNSEDVLQLLYTLSSLCEGESFTPSPLLSVSPHAH